MSYRFQSKATGDVLMLDADADRVLRAMGLIPAAQGILPPAAMPAAIDAIEAAIARDESQVAPTQAVAASADSDASDHPDISLHQRAWPLLEMMRRAHAEGEAIVWGV